MNSGYVKLYRSLLDWEWYSDANTTRLFIHLLLTVNHAPVKWKGITVKKGQRIASYSQLVAEIGLSERSVRTAIKHLIATGDVTLSITPKYSLYCVTNYCKYQEMSGESTPKRHPSDTLYTNNKKNKKNKNDKNNILRHFETFWAAYPKKTGKQDALKRWTTVNPDEELVAKIMSAVEAQKKGDGWIRDNGKYIPNPATWLNRGDWDNEPVNITGNKPERSYDTSTMDESVNDKWVDYVKEDRQ